MGNYIFQWGPGIAQNGNTNTFPTPFPNACDNIQATITIGSATNDAMGITGISKTGFITNVASTYPNTMGSIQWFAVGH